jgi:hypothetical protein
MLPHAGKTTMSGRLKAGYDMETKYGRAEAKTRDNQG